MDTTQELLYLEFQTRKRNGEKEQLTVGTLVTGQLFQIFLRKPMPCKIFKRDLKKFSRAKYCTL